jgi:hypothetical protein
LSTSGTSLTSDYLPALANVMNKVGSSTSTSCRH